MCKCEHHVAALSRDCRSSTSELLSITGLGMVVPVILLGERSDLEELLTNMPSQNRSEQEAGDR